MTAQFDPNIDAKTCDPAMRSVVVAHRPGFYRNIGKRVLETLLVLLALPAVLPLILLLALPMLLRGERPFYTQPRVGLGGQTFVMWKFRTMIPNADDHLEDHLGKNPSARREWERHQKLTDDPRVTPYGRILRKLSLDELPQLWNVLKGDMALIGPRPFMLHQRVLYHGLAYYALRPGISGYWQVSDRHGAEFVSRVHYDDMYDRDVSLATDVSLILRTLRVILRATGI